MSFRYLYLKSNVHVSMESQLTYAWQLFLELAVIRSCCEMFRGNEYCLNENAKQKTKALETQTPCPYTHNVHRQRCLQESSEATFSFL